MGTARVAAAGVAVEAAVEAADVAAATAWPAEVAGVAAAVTGVTADVTGAEPTLADPEPEPVASGPEPVAVDPEPAVLTAEPAVLTAEPALLAAELAVSATEPAVPEDELVLLAELVALGLVALGPVLAPEPAASAAGLEGTGALPEVAGNAEEVAVAAAETACETPDAAEVTGAELAVAELAVVELAVADPAAAAEGLPEPLLPMLVAPAGEPVVAAVTAEVTDAVADVTAEVLETGDDAPEVTGEVDPCVGVTGGEAKVAAFACRENTRKIKKSPAATMANCTARRTMRRTIIGCGMSSSPVTPETGLGPPALNRRHETMPARSYVGLVT